MSGGAYAMRRGDGGARVMPMSMPSTEEGWAATPPSRSSPVVRRRSRVDDSDGLDDSDDDGSDYSISTVDAGSSGVDHRVAQRPDGRAPPLGSSLNLDKDIGEMEVSTPPLPLHPFTCMY